MGLRCPKCSSKDVVRDGLRYIKGYDPIQRYLCKFCALRFTDFHVKRNVTRQVVKGSEPRKNHTNRAITRLDFSSKKLADCLPFDRSKDVRSHGVSVVEQDLNPLRIYNREYRVSASAKNAKNSERPCMALEETIEKNAVVTRDTQPTQQDIKGSLTVYASKQLTTGLTEATITRRMTMLKQLAKLGADLLNPSSVWKTIDTATTKQINKEDKAWTNGTKALAGQAYLAFCKITKNAIPEDLNFHKWKAQSKIPWVPLETEVDQLIAACRLRMASFLQLLKECGCRCGEAWALTWKNFDAEHGVITINNPEKNGHPRQHKISSKLVAMLNSLPKTNEKIWNGNIHVFVAQRNRIARKLQNPRFKEIHWHSLRHFYSSMLYHKTLNLLEVQQKLGHRNISSTVIYTHLVNFDSDEFLHAHAKTLQEEDALLDAGYEYVRYSEKDQVAIYRKRK